MPSPVNILTLIHGMTPADEPVSPYRMYESFWSALVSARPELEQIIAKRVGVQWGHEMVAQPTDVDRAWGFLDGAPFGALRPDERLTRAQTAIKNLISYREIQKTPGPNNRVLGGLAGDFGMGVGALLRKFTTPFRENMVVSGIGDVVYYCSEEGETYVRQVVYDQILRNLDPFLGRAEVRFHIFSHSMGVTVAHDFLYGLFAPGHEPDFVKRGQGSVEARKRYEGWRAKAQRGELRLGSLGTAASQIPLFAMRKQRFVDHFFQGHKIDPSVIGVTEKNKIQWNVFYDIDDVLGFATRRLYSPDHAIRDVQVDCGTMPDPAHTGYWKNADVIRWTADSIVENAS